MPKKTATLTPSWELLPQSFHLLLEYFIPCLYIVIFPALIDLLGMLYLGDLKHWYSTTATGIILVVLSGIITLLFRGAYVYLQLQAAKKKQVSVLSLFKRSWRFLPRLIGFNIVFSFLLLCGLLLFIVPGLIVLRRYILTEYYIVDKDLSIKEAMRRSSAETKPMEGYVWGVLGVYCVLIVVGFLISQTLHPVGPVLGNLLGFAYIFALPLRYLEISRGLKLPPRTKGWSTTIED